MLGPEGIEGEGGGASYSYSFFNFFHSLRTSPYLFKNNSFSLPCSGLSMVPFRWERCRFPGRASSENIKGRTVSFDSNSNRGDLPKARYLFHRICRVRRSRRGSCNKSRTRVRKYIGEANKSSISTALYYRPRIGTLSDSDAHARAGRPLSLFPSGHASAACK